MSAYRAGEPVVVSVTLKNVANNVGRYVLSNTWADHEFVVKDAHGKAVPLSPDGRRRAENVPVFTRAVRTLRPRGEFEAKVIMNRLFDLSKSGVYTVMVKRQGAPSAATASAVLNVGGAPCASTA